MNKLESEFHKIRKEGEKNKNSNRDKTAGSEVEIFLPVCDTNLGILKKSIASLNNLLIIFIFRSRSGFILLITW